MIDKGKYWQGNCPLHGDKHPSLTVYKSDATRFKCFGCGARGDVIDFIRQLKKISFIQAVEYLGIDYQNSQVIVPYPKLIDSIAREEQEGIKVKEKYRELLIAMGWEDNNDG